MSDQLAILPLDDYDACVAAIKAKLGNNDPIKSGQLAAKVAAIEGGGGGTTEYIPMEGPAIPDEWTSLYIEALGRFRTSFPSAAFANVAIVTRPATAEQERAGLAWSGASFFFLSTGFAVTGRSHQNAAARGCWCVCCSYVESGGAWTLQWEGAVDGSATPVMLLDFLAQETIAWCSTFVGYDGVLLYPVRTCYSQCPRCYGSGEITVVEDEVSSIVPCPDCNATGQVSRQPADFAGAGALTYIYDDVTSELVIYAAAEESEEEET